MFEKYMIVPELAKNRIVEKQTIGFQIGARLPYYRGVPLSMIEEIEISVNGEVLPQENVSIEIDEKLFNKSQREDELEYRWEMGEVINLIIYKNGGLDKGIHRIGLKINLRIGYLPFPAIRYFERDVRF